MNGIVERLLEGRGLSGAELEAFLDPSLKRLAPSSGLPCVSAAADVMLPFVRSGRRIVVFADYDCDGVCASAILVKTIRRLGGNADAFIPSRFNEGYGMTPASVERMLAECPDAALVVTVDCGITSAAEVRSLRERGIAVVVTDHHLPPGALILPECDALIDPKIPAQNAAASAIGAADLCGAGVAFFLASALVQRAVELGFYDGGKFAAPLLVLAGLATVVDMVPLLGQNRILAANSLRTFKCAPIGLRELLLRAQRHPVDLSSYDYGFMLGPRINAPGRVASALEAYRLIMTEDREEARNLAQQVDVRNSERKSVEDGMAALALEQVDMAAIGAAAVVNSEESAEPEKWHVGVCGIVASRIMEKCGVPVAVVADGHGSVRAPGGYDVHAALSACADLLERFGGHKAAGGFSVKEGRFAEFREAFVAACAAQGAAIGGAVVFREPEMWVEPGDLTMELAEGLKLMEPFGEGNPRPVFGLRGVAFANVNVMGKDGGHAAFRFADGRIPRATWWGHGAQAEELRAHSLGRFDVTFTLEISEWGGDAPHPELRLCALRKTSPG